jgi:hypothetical protein
VRWGIVKTGAGGKESCFQEKGKGDEERFQIPV